MRFALVPYRKAGLLKKIHKKFVSTDRRELQDAIDESNIHGWLQGRIHDGEGRYAALVTTLLQEDANRLQTLKKTWPFIPVRKSGRKCRQRHRKRFINWIIPCLNGMPCDQVMKVTESNPDKVVWEETSGFTQLVLERTGCLLL